MCNAFYRRSLSVCLILASSSGFSAQPVKEDFEAAILGSKSFAEDVLNQMDVNADSKVDVGDLIRFLKRTNTPIFYGYQWLVTASYQPTQGNAIPLNYSFVLNLSSSTTAPVVGSLGDFDPTRSVLRQGTPQSYALTHLIPEGSTFILSEAGDNVTLQTNPITVAPDNPGNPTAMALSRAWTLVIYRSTLQTGVAVNGTITQSIQGLLPNGQAIQTTGTIFMVPLKQL